MASSPSRANPATPDDEARRFDPKAPVVDSWGIRYPDFKAFLLGRPYEDDRLNQALRAHRQKGRSQAFCQAFAKGYEEPTHLIETPQLPPGKRSERGWNWAIRQGFANEYIAVNRAYSDHNTRFGLGLDAARRAVESDPGA